MLTERQRMMEVRTNIDGWYYCTVHQFNKDNEEDPDYIREWFESINGEWDYGKGWDGNVYVCFIHKRED